MNTQHSICPGCNGVIQYEATAALVTCPQCQMQFNGPGAGATQPTPPTTAHVVQQPYAPAQTPHWQQPAPPRTNANRQAGTGATGEWQQPAPAAYNAQAEPMPLGPEHAAPTPMPQQPAPTPAAAMYPGATPTTQPTPFVKQPNRNGAMIAVVAGTLALGLAALVIGGTSLYFLLTPTSDSNDAVAQGPIAQPNVKDTSINPAGTPFVPEPMPTPMEPPVFTPPPIPEVPPAANFPPPVATSVTPEPQGDPPATVSVPSTPVAENGADTPSPVPAPQVPVREPASGTQNGLRYKWKKGDEHTYSITIKTEQEGKEKTIHGACTYRVGAKALSGFQAEDATGTAFVVSADGHLVTCAHVIEDADEIEVTIAGKRYSASVVDTNYVQDIALLRVNATDLTALPFVDSEGVQHGQEIRAVGFPLSTVLGKDVKVTKGTISGFVQEEHGKRFQIDASINPGNSGGPIVDQKGNVVGIASSKLLGIEVTSVGFAVPANEALKMLKSHQVNVVEESATKTLDGPQLVAAVKPAIAYVKASFGSAGRERFNITYNGNYTHQVPMAQSRAGGRMGFGGRFGPGRFGGGPQMVNETENASGSLRASQYGEVSDFKGDVQFPFVLGPVGQLCIEDLHHHHSRKWGSESQTELHIIERAKSNSPFGPRLGPGFNPRDPFGRNKPKDKVKESYPAIERTRYSLESESDDAFTLKKTYEFRTLEDEENPYLLVKGAGTVIVDKKLGMPKSLNFDATLVRNIDNATIRMPMKVSYALRDPAEVAVEREKAAERMAKMREELERKKKEKAEAEKTARTVPNPAAVRELVAKISGKEVNNALIYSDLDKLAKLAIVEEQRDVVIALAEKHLPSTHAWASRNSILVLLSWGRKEDQLRLLTPIVSNVDKRIDSQVRGPLFTKLSEYREPAVTKALIMRLTVSSDAKDASKALIAVGSSCESLLLTAMPKNEKIQANAASILKEIGTRKALPVLERAELNSKSSTVRRALREARNAIEERVSSTS